MKDLTIYMIFTMLFHFHTLKALSGNLLRKLRTSRFTCDEDEEEGRGGAGDLIKDACSGIPIKTPFQVEIQTIQESVNRFNLAHLGLKT